MERSTRGSRPILPERGTRRVTTGRMDGEVLPRRAARVRSAVPAPEDRGRKNRSDHLGLSDRRDHPTASRTSRTGENFGVEHPADQIRPRQAALPQREELAARHRRRQQRGAERIKGIAIEHPAGECPQRSTRAAADPGDCLKTTRGSTAKLPGAARIHRQSGRQARPYSGQRHVPLHPCRGIAAADGADWHLASL